MKENSNYDDLIINLEGISKSFPGVKALDNVSVGIRKGEILAILGENGAGKSTLMKILAGLYQPDAGYIQVNTSWFKDVTTSDKELQQIEIANPRMAMKMGIGMVYQHFQLVEPLNVTDNITLGLEITKGKTIIINKEESISKVREIGEKFSMPIDPLSIVEELPVGLRQRVEILKQLYRNAELLILDEPTAVLTPLEVEGLFKTIKSLKAAGKSIIFISHKLKEPIAIADRIVVMRKGKFVGEIMPKDATTEILAEMVVGKKVLRQINRKELEVGDKVLSVQNIDFKDPVDSHPLLNNFSMDVFKNRIVGVAGVQGNGQTELVDCIIGLKKQDGGNIYFYDKQMNEHDFSKMNTLKRLHLGIGYIPEDRNDQGLIADLPLTENIWLGFHGKSTSERLKMEKEYDVEKKSKENPIQEFLSKMSNSLLLPFQLMSKMTKKIMDQFEVMTSSENAQVGNLSGGNQQKILLGREFAKNPNLIIASQPTRGVDVGVMEKVHQELVKRRNDGAAILLISSDLDEILYLADYIIIMYEGSIVGEGTLEELSVKTISELMTGGIIEEEVKQ